MWSEIPAACRGLSVADRRGFNGNCIELRSPTQYSARIVSLSVRLLHLVYRFEDESVGLRYSDFSDAFVWPESIEGLALSREGVGRRVCTELTVAIVVDASRCLH